MSASSPPRKNIFVLCLDEHHLADLERIPDRDQFAFHGLLSRREVQEDLEGSLMRMERMLNDFDGSIDGIIGYWDFPVTVMVPILCEKFGLPSPSLQAVLKCAHKYWSRLEQRRYIPECTPSFCPVDPFADDPFSQVTLDYPFWIKPVCAYQSVLGFRINKRADFDRAMEIARRKIRAIGDPFSRILSRVDTSELHGVGGNHMIAEELIHGIELAPEGYVQHGEFHVHGMIDMVRASNHKSFQDYRYPSLQPRRIQNLTIEASRKLLQGMGYDNGCFNIEYFWDRHSDRLRIVEVNTSISQFHSNLMYKVDGMSNYEVAVHVAVGDEPHFEHGGGQFKMAAKFLYRRFDDSDAICLSAPSDEDLARLKDRQPETVVSILIEEGTRLSETADQDQYSWLLAELVIGGDDVGDLNRQFAEAKMLLPFKFKPLPAAHIDQHRSSSEGRRQGV